MVTLTITHLSVNVRDVNYYCSTCKQGNHLKKLFFLGLRGIFCASDGFMKLTVFCELLSPHIGPVCLLGSDKMMSNMSCVGVGDRQ